MPLSNDQVKDAIRAGDRVKLADGAGLYLVVRKPGLAYWIKQYRNGASFSSTSLGTAGKLTPAAARRAREAFDVARRKQPRQRHHVAHHAVAAATGPTNGMTFADARAAFLERRLADWSESEQKYVRRLLEKLAAPLDAKRLDTITDQDIADVLRPTWRGTGSNQGTRLRALLERVFNSQRVSPNPADWTNLKERELLSAKASSVVSHAALQAEQVPGLVARLQTSRAGACGDVVDRALRFVILTGCRVSEATEAQWHQKVRLEDGRIVDELDLAGKLWTIPADRMKAGVVHRVPLSDAAIACLGKPGKGFVFPATKGAAGGVNRTGILAMLKKLEPNATTHGMRATLATWAQEQGYASDVIEVQLAHQEPNRSKKAYQRSEFLPERRKLMEAWAAFIES
jgi:integrase